MPKKSFLERMGLVERSNKMDDLSVPESDKPMYEQDASDFEKVLEAESNPDVESKLQDLELKDRLLDDFNAGNTTSFGFAGFDILEENKSVSIEDIIPTDTSKKILDQEEMNADLVTEQLQNQSFVESQFASAAEEMKREEDAPEISSEDTQAEFSQTENEEFDRDEEINKSIDELMGLNKKSSPARSYSGSSLNNSLLNELDVYHNETLEPVSLSKKTESTEQEHSITGEKMADENNVVEEHLHIQSSSVVEESFKDFNLFDIKENEETDQIDTVESSSVQHIAVTPAADTPANDFSQISMDIPMNDNSSDVSLQDDSLFVQSDERMDTAAQENILQEDVKMDTVVPDVHITAPLKNNGKQQEASIHDSLEIEEVSFVETESEKVAYHTRMADKVGSDLHVDANLKTASTFKADPYIGDKLDLIIGAYEKNKLLSIEEIYRNSRMETDTRKTIFMTDVFLQAIPTNLPLDVKRETVLNILKISGIDLEMLLSDAYKRIDSLNKVHEDTIATSNDIFERNENTIRELERRIQDLKDINTARQEFQEDQNTMIEYEVQKIINLVEFVKPKTR